MYHILNRSGATHLAVFVQRGRVGPVLQQQRHDRAVPEEAGEVQGGVEVGGLVARAGPVAEEQRRHLEVPRLSGPMEGGVAFLRKARQFLRMGCGRGEGRGDRVDGEETP